MNPRVPYLYSMKDRILHTMRLEGRVKESGDGGVFGRLPKGDKPPKTWVWKQSPQILHLLLPVVQFNCSFVHTS